MKKVVTIAGLLFSFVAASGQAGSKDTRWRLIATSEHFDYRLDTRTVRHLSDELVEAWIKEQLHGGFLDRLDGKMVVQGRREKARLSTEGYGDFDSEVLQYEINCRTRKLRTLESIDYAENGTVLDSVQTPKDAWGSVAPDSIGEKVINAVCSYKPVKQPHRK